MRISGRYLEQELLRFLGPGRDSQILARYYGLDGLGGRTLLSVGKQVGLTRERVRQIVTAASKRMNTQLPVPRMLNRTVAFVSNHMPASAEEIEAELNSEGLTFGLFRLEGVIKAAHLFGKSPPFSITKVKGKRIVHPRHIPSVNAVTRIARRLVANRGMATLSDVVGEVRRVEFGECDRDLVAMLLAHREDFSWLDRSSGWFWFSDKSNNPVLNRLRKILSVAKWISISELRKGIARDYRMRGFWPPARVLLEFCRQVPELRVHHNSVKPKKGINPDRVLTKAERDIVGILTKYGPVIARGRLRALCVDLGMNCATFVHTLEYSPVFARNASGQYRVIGSRPAL